MNLPGSRNTFFTGQPVSLSVLIQRSSTSMTQMIFDPLREDEEEVVMMQHSLRSYPKSLGSHVSWLLAR